MRAKDVQDYVMKEPFVPFRITLTDGRTYDIHHPELAMVGRSAVTLGLRAPDEDDLIYDRLITVSLLHVMQIEPISGQTAPTPSGESNGQ